MYWIDGLDENSVLEMVDGLWWTERVERYERRVHWGIGRHNIEVRNDEWWIRDSNGKIKEWNQNIDWVSRRYEGYRQSSIIGQIGLYQLDWILEIREC